jgi:hypothetical protein
MSKKVLLAFLVSILLITSFKPLPATSKTVYVYICEGPYSKVYHKADDCKGLSNCSTKIYKVTLEEAVKMGRRPCKIEYR